MLGVFKKKQKLPSPEMQDIIVFHNSIQHIHTCFNHIFCRLRDSVTQFGGSINEYSTFRADL